MVIVVFTMVVTGNIPVSQLTAEIALQDFITTAGGTPNNFEPLPGEGI
jgi:hypothetical protein